MGKTKIKTIDDAAQVAESPKQVGRRDELVEKLKAELGVEEPKLVKETKPKAKPTKLGKAKPGSLPRAKPRGKKYQETTKDLDRSKTYPLNEAVEMVKKLSYSKFEGTLEAHINTVQTGLRGTGYKTEPKAPVIHLGLGKLDQPTEQLAANIKTLLQSIGKTRIKKISLSPTMGPSVKMDINSI